MTLPNSREPVPANPKIYHITHVKNLPRILATSCLYSDAKRIELNLDCHEIGMNAIKERRLKKIEVSCHPGTTVGEYVPFYYCPRSVMLYIFYIGNHPDLTYHGGQEPIVHLQMDISAVVAWAEAKVGKLWAISDGNAGTFYTYFYKDLEKLSEIDWQAVKETDFRNIKIKEGKQAEFLIQESVSWGLVEKIGVHNERIAQKVNNLLSNIDYQPQISVENSWYY